MMTNYECWCQNHYFDDFFVKMVTFSILIIGHRNRRSESCQQCKRFPASVTNIDVTAANCPFQVVVARKLLIKASGLWQQAADSQMLLASNNNQRKDYCRQHHVVCWLLHHSAAIIEIFSWLHGFIIFLLFCIYLNPLITSGTFCMISSISKDHLQK